MSVPMKVGCNSHCFWRHFYSEKKTINQMKWLEFCAGTLGLDGVEMVFDHFDSTSKSHLRNLKRRCCELQMELMCVSPGNDFGKLSEAKIAAQMRHLRKWIDIAFFLGAPMVRIYSGNPEKEELRQSTWPLMIKRLKEITRYAAERGIILALENHNHGGFTDTAENVIKMMNQVNSPWLRPLLDVGNFGAQDYPYEVDFYPAIEKLAPTSLMVHVKHYGPDRQGRDKKIDYERVMKILKKANYQGYLSIEYEGEEDAFTAMPRIVKYLRKLLQ